MKSDEAMAAEQGLEAKLAEAGLDQVRGPSFDAAPEGTPVESETVQDDRPRNELGQFAAVDEPEANEVAEPEMAEPEPEQVTSEDPAVAQYLQKYGGDVNKAIAAAVHAQRQLGKQSTEVGELRSQNAEYEALLEELRGLRGDFQQERARQPLDQTTLDSFDQYVMESPYQAAEYARQQNNQLLMQRALSTWKEMDPYGAAVYTNSLQNQETEARIRAEVAKAQQLPTDATLHMALTNVQSQHPEYANYGDMIESTINKYPSAAKAVEIAVTNGNMAEIEASLETLYDLAIGETLRQQALTGPAPDETSTTADVVQPATAEPHDAPAEPTQKDEFRDAFRQEMEQRRRGVFVAE